MAQNSFCILHGIKGFYLCFAGSACFTIAPLCLHLLNVGTVPKHNATQVCSRIGGYDLPLKSSGIDPGKHACMVNVGVGQKYVVNVAVTDRKFRILVRIVPLLHTTVNKDFCISYFQKMTAACNFMVCSDKH